MRRRLTPQPGPLRPPVYQRQTLRVSTVPMSPRRRYVVSASRRLIAAATRECFTVAWAVVAAPAANAPDATLRSGIARPYQPRSVRGRVAH